MENHPNLQQCIQGDDSDSLNYLQDIHVEQSGDETLTHLKFVFVNFILFFILSHFFFFLIS